MSHHFFFNSGTVRSVPLSLLQQHLPPTLLFVVSDPNPVTVEQPPGLVTYLVSVRNSR